MVSERQGPRRLHQNLANDSREARVTRLIYGVFLLVLAHPALAQVNPAFADVNAEIEMVRSLVRMERKAAVEQAMQLTPAESLDLLDRLHQDGLTVVISTHDLELATTRFDRLLLLNRRLHADGPAGSTLTPERLTAAYGGRLTFWRDGQPVTVAADDCCP